MAPDGQADDEVGGVVEVVEELAQGVFGLAYGFGFEGYGVGGEEAGERGFGGDR